MKTVESILGIGCTKIAAVPKAWAIKIGLGELLAVFFIFSTLTTMSAQGYKKLSKEEEAVIVHKGTEAPFSGEYNNFFKSGAYYCKQCNAKLYNSTDKFASTCGWPSFDDEIKGAVKRMPDADGRRTEILCAHCGAHLGHMFQGEELTPKNVRHCVNSISLVFKPAVANEAAAYFAGGCFWGVEYFFEKNKGVIDAVSGYMGGTKEKPSYKEVSQGNTGYFETVKVVYDPTQVSYEQLAKFFFEIHDPTQANGQGPDIGQQYLSVVFYKNNDEHKTAQDLIQQLKSKHYKVVTQVLPAGHFWPAEDYHQDYYAKTHKTPYCHHYQKRF